MAGHLLRLVIMPALLRWCSQAALRAHRVVVVCLLFFLVAVTSLEWCKMNLLHTMDGKELERDLLSSTQ